MYIIETYIFVNLYICVCAYGFYTDYTFTFYFIFILNGKKVIISFELRVQVVKP